MSITGSATRLCARRIPYYPLLLIQAVLFTAFLTHTYHWDGVLFSVYIEGIYDGRFPAAILFHPNHLLYNVVGYGLYAATRAGGLAVRALVILQLFNVFLSACASYVFFLLARRLTGSFFLSFGCSIVFTFGALWWKYSTDGDSYILTILLLLLAALAAFARPPLLAVTGICHALAMFFHELAIFFYVPVLCFIALDAARPRVQRVWRSSAYVAATGGCVAVVYLGSYKLSGHPSGMSFTAWIASYASDSRFVQSPWEIIGPNLASYSKLFLGGKLVFLRDYFSALMLVAMLVCVMALGAAILLWRRPVPESPLQIEPKAYWFLWAWIAPFFIFLAVFEPGNPIHKVFVWPPIVLLIGLWVAAKKRLRQRQAAFTACAVALAAWNFAAFAYPHSHDSADPVLSLAKRINVELPLNATVYYRYLDPDDWYIEYFAPGRKWLPLDVSKPALPTDVGLTCVEATAFYYLQSNPLTAAELARRLDPHRAWRLVNSHHNMRLECLSHYSVVPTHPDFERPAHSLQ